MKKTDINEAREANDRKEIYEKFLDDKEYYIHHWAMATGYVSKKKDYTYEKYNGRFGEGFVFHHANLSFPIQGKSKKYHWIEYIIKRA